MSSCNITRITCQKCKYAQDFTIWNSVNVDLDFSLKDRLLSGELTRFTCDQCHNTSEVVYPLLYHDMERKLMVYFSAGKVMPDHTTLPFGRIINGYKLRIVASRNQLVEKIWIAEAGIDDRAMELFKLAFISQMKASADDELLFAGEDRDPDGTHFAKFAFLNKGKIESITTRMQTYKDFADDFAELLEIEAGNLGEWLHINRKFAEDWLAKFTQET